jgi:hypothetical protein
VPNKTIYVKDIDLALFEQAQEQLGESLSSLFAEFLRERLATLSPAEERIIALRELISERREALKDEEQLPRYLDAFYAEALEHTKKAMKSLRAGEVREAKTNFFAANSFFERAEREVRDCRTLKGKIRDLFG